jgi:hypothetical protein
MVALHAKSVPFLKKALARGFPLIMMNDGGNDDLC